MVVMGAARVFAETQRVAKPPTLGAAWALVLGLSACGPSAAMLTGGEGSTSDAGMPDTSATDSDVFEEPRPPDLGPDVVICGRPGEDARTDVEIAALEGCEIYEAGVGLNYPDVTDLSPLGSLRIIRGSLFTYAQNPGPETLAGLDNLESVGEVRLDGEALKDLSGLRNLRSVELAFTLDGAVNLTSLDGLEHLRTVGGGIGLKIQSNPGLTNLDGLAGLEWIGTNLSIGDNDLLEDLDGLAALRQVGGDVWIIGNAALPPAAIDAFIERVEIGGVVHVD